MMKSTIRDNDAHFSVSKEEQHGMSSRSFPQPVRRIRASNNKPNGCECAVKSAQALCTSQTMMLHGSVCEHVKEFGNINEGEVLQNKDGGGRERLKRHREQVAGRVLIPDQWGQEELLKDWIDCSAFESLLVPNKIASARKALAAEGRRPSSTALLINN